jgi:hypothetical protein
LDWAPVIDRNRTALKPIVENLFVMLGLAGAATRIPRGVHRNLLRLLRPTESAVMDDPLARQSRIEDATASWSAGKPR